MNNTRSYIMTMLKVIAVSVTIFVVWMDAQGVEEKPRPAEKSISQIAMEEAMTKCKPLPPGTLPGAVVIDYVDLEPFYSVHPLDVDWGFKYALDAGWTFKGERGVLHRHIQGVTLCK